MERVVLSVGEVAKALNIGRSTVYSLIHGGYLPSLRLGPKRLFVPREAFERMLAGAGVLVAGEQESPGQKEGSGD